MSIFLFKFHPQIFQISCSSDVKALMQPLERGIRNISSISGCQSHFLIAPPFPFQIKHVC